MAELVDRIAMDLDVDVRVPDERQRHRLDQIVVDRGWGAEHEVRGLAQRQTSSTRTFMRR